jgi:lysyl-tRNA synthetase class 2
MKRLLAAGSGSIYQISKVFRDGEAGRRHNPEFTLLEWYRTGFDHLHLMDEVEALVVSVLQGRLSLRETQRLSYREAFVRHAGIDPHAADTVALGDCTRRHGIAMPAGMENADRSLWLDLLMTHVVEAQLGRECLCFVYDYPADQASLARIRPGAPALAERFELYVQGVELANGFHELADSAEQRRRFEQDNAARQARGLPVLPVDEHLLAALGHGLPDCAGVALGLDRLVMLAADARAIQDVISFPIDRA